MEQPKNYWLGDVSHCMGHCWNIGMRDVAAGGKDPIVELFASSAGDYQKEKEPTPNFESHAFIHSIGGIAAYTHPLRIVSRLCNLTIVTQGATLVAPATMQQVLKWMA